MTTKTIKLKQLVKELDYNKMVVSAIATDFFKDDTVPLPEKWKLFVDSDIGREHRHFQNIVSIHRFRTYVDDPNVVGGRRARNPLLQAVLEAEAAEGARPGMPCDDFVFYLSRLRGADFNITTRSGDPIIVSVTREDINAVMMELMLKKISGFYIRGLDPETI
jgi:hypothetical protein